MSTYRGLPPGARQWASEVNAAMAQVEELQAVVKRLSENLSIDPANPQRGINDGAIPSARNPVMLKLPSLHDLDIRDAQDGDLLTFDGKRGVWTARKHNTVVQPKVFPDGDPASYYVAPVVVPPATITPADTWSSPVVATNYVTDPSFETGIGGWLIASDMQDDSTNVAKSITQVPGGRSGASAIKIVLGAPSNGTSPAPYSNSNYISVMLPVPEKYLYMPISIKLDPMSTTIAAYAHLHVLDSTGAVVAGGYGAAQTLDGLYDWNWHDFIIQDRTPVPAGGSKRLLLRFGGNFEGAALDNAVAYVDCFGRTESATYFDGSTPADADYAYSWTGAANASPSTQTTTRQIEVPSVITLGKTFEVLGRGFPANTSVDVQEWDWYSTHSLVTTDSSGNFSTTLTIPVNTDPNVGPVAGPGTIGASLTGFSPTIPVTLID